MKNLFIASLGSLTLAGAASAAPTGLYWESSLVNVNGQDYCVGRLYICFDVQTGVLLNAYNTTASLNQGTFNHNDFTTGGVNAPIGSWSPNNFFPPLFGNPAIDSYLTIGGTTSNAALNANTTTFDPSFNGGNGSSVGGGGGWFNSNPTNLQGKSGVIDGQPGWYTLVGQFVVLGDGSGTTLSYNGSFTGNNGLGTPAQQVTYTGLFEFCGPVPAPGALALLGLAGLAGGRRRRA
jgi:MYXO-CTERM domain-containing protein